MFGLSELYFFCGLPHCCKVGIFGRGNNALCSIAKLRSDAVGERISVEVGVVANIEPAALALEHGGAVIAFIRRRRCAQRATVVCCEVSTRGCRSWLLPRYHFVSHVLVSPARTGARNIAFCNS